jgi:hypothetical protein
MAKPQGASLWYCELCKIQVWIKGRPSRLRHAVCRKWLTFVKKVADGER